MNRLLPTVVTVCAVLTLAGGWWLSRPAPVDPVAVPTGNAGLTRPSQRPQLPAAVPGGGALPSAETATDAEALRFPLNGQRDFLLLLRALGTSLEDLEAWARSRGFPPATFTTGVGIPLDQPYRRYDEATLRGLAESGDRWAMQFLAADLQTRAPLESIDLYRTAAVAGSVFAARELGMLLRDLDLGVRTNQRLDAATRTALEHMDAGQDLAESGLAWLIAAEVEGGLPPGYLSADAVASTWPDTLARACEEAAVLLANLAEERADRGLAGPAGRPPPFTVAPPGEGLERACPEGVLSAMPEKGCVPVILTAGSNELTGWRCAEG